MRKSDSKEKAFFRVRKRLYCENGQWFFQAREGVRGPFRSEHDAEAELRLYVGSMEFVEDNDPQKHSNIDWGSVTVVDGDNLAPGTFSNRS
jgi:hypothetical protein